MNPWILRRRERWILLAVGALAISFSLWRWIQHGAQP